MMSDLAPAGSVPAGCAAVGRAINDAFASEHSNIYRLSWAPGPAAPPEAAAEARRMLRTGQLCLRLPEPPG